MTRNNGRRYSRSILVPYHPGANPLCPFCRALTNNLWDGTIHCPCCMAFFGGPEHAGYYEMPMEVGGVLR
jgi:hypothetical protein